jgi:hypothetical protein
MMALKMNLPYQLVGNYERDETYSHLQPAIP